MLGDAIDTFITLGDNGLGTSKREEVDVEEHVDLAQTIRDIPDFPAPGIVFKDITTLLKDPGAFRYAIDSLTEYYQDQDIDVIVGIESRGFIFAAPLAYNLGKPLVPVRKLGTLPGLTAQLEYSLGNRTNTLEMHRDAVEPDQHVLIVDDLLGTGRTAAATAQLVSELGGIVVGVAVVVELTTLEGRQNLEDYDVYSLVQF